MPYKRLTDDERFDIYDKKKEGLSLSKIASIIVRDKSTISREIRRNCGLKGYRPKQAQQLAEMRSHKRRGGRIIDAKTVWQCMVLLQCGYSPEQASGRCRLDGHGLISHETIYKLFYSDKREGGSLYKSLRCSKKYRKRYAAGRDRRGRIPQKIGIEKRCSAANLRQEIGHWEGDTVIGKNRRYALVTMVERKTGFCRIAKTKTRNADEIAQAIVRILYPLKNLVKTITFDNGLEFSRHQSIAQSLDASIYFADPYASWQRGSNENLNGLIRQYFPKAMSFEGITHDDLIRVENSLNLRARKRLDWRAPSELIGWPSTAAAVALAL